MREVSVAVASSSGLANVSRATDRIPGHEGLKLRARRD